MRPAATAWSVLGPVPERAIALPGPSPHRSALAPEPEVLRSWLATTLERYWAGQVAGVRTGSRPMRPAATEWNVLGPLRLHATIATGQVLSKDEAGAYGQQLFGDGSGIIAVARAVLTGAPIPDRPRRALWRELTAETMDQVIQDAYSLAAH